MESTKIVRTAWIGISLLAAAWPTVTLGRTAQQITHDIEAVEEQIQRFPSEAYLEPKYRQSLLEQAGPALRQKAQLYLEFSKVDARTRLTGLYECDSTLALLAVLEDPDAARLLDQAVADSDPAVSECGRLGLLQRDWWTNSTEEGQRKVLDQLIGYAQQAPKDDVIARTLVVLADNSPATPALAREARVTAAGLPGSYAAQYRAIPNKVGWPLTITGNTVDGRSFSPAQWKGKVVVVDFWATWCGPCKAAMPHMIDLYNKLHSDGLEVIGVSNDQDRSELVQFLQQNRAMAWPQLFGPSSSPSHWNAMAEAFHVSAIPTMYVIDRNGLLQKISVAREADEEIKQLLAQKPDPALADGMKPVKLAPPTPAAAPVPKAAIATKVAPAGAAAPAVTPPPAPSAPAVDDPAMKATRAMNLARSYIKAERFEIARTKLQAIIATWPTTPAAKDAAVALKEIEGKF